MIACKKVYQTIETIKDGSATTMNSLQVGNSNKIKIYK